MSARDAHEGIILVADANESHRAPLTTLLVAEGYQVISVADGQQALEQVGFDSIDLALLDVVMPRKTGFDVCLAIKSKPATRLIPVLPSVQTAKSGCWSYCCSSSFYPCWLALTGCT